ncbi:MAG: hypothetical protein ACI4OX_08445 [Akkermansia sp.]
MKARFIATAVLGLTAMVFSSCDYGYWTVGGTYHTPHGSVTTAWTNASYDADGFPIYGYYYGRPVYGYTAAGVAIFSLAAITAACIVPHWHPAPWYRGSWHYPPRVRRMAVPPHVPGGHHPGVRPAGGMNAPIHRNPASVLHPTPSRPAHPSGPSHTPPRGVTPPHFDGHSSSHRPNNGNAHFTRPTTPPSNFSGSSSSHRPNNGNAHFTRPTTPPSNFSGSSSSHRPDNGNAHFTRPAAPSRPNSGNSRFTRPTGGSSSDSRPHSGSSRFTRPSRG